MKRLWGKVCVAIVACVVGSQFGIAEAYPELNKFRVNRIPEWPVRTADVGGTLLFSDSPELVKEDGILYADTVEGKVRLLYYHLNASKKEKKIVVVIENKTDEPADITINNYAMGGPSEDYLFVGKSTQEQYFKNNNIAFCQVEPKGTRLLNQKFAQIIVKPEKLVYGVFDFTTKTPVKVSVMMLPPGTDPLKFVKIAKVLPADKSHLRGTFTGMDRIVQGVRPYDSMKDGLVAVTLADGKIDRYRTGIDATDGRIVENYGNYGVLYKIHLPTKGAGRTRYFLNPRGGVYAGAISLHHGRLGRSQMIETPRNEPYFGDERQTTDTTFIGDYSNTDTITMEFSPPGASNLPARLILSPPENT